VAAAVPAGGRVLDARDGVAHAHSVELLVARPPSRTLPSPTLRLV
jgi:hypothetical protein